MNEEPAGKGDVEGCPQTSVCLWVLFIWRPLALSQRKRTIAR